MKGIFLKDYYLLRGSAALLIASLLVICALLAIMFGPGSLIVLPAIFSIIFSSLVFNVIAIDKASKWNSMVVAFPVTQRALLREKYLLYCCMILVGACAGAVLCGCGFAVSGKLLETNPYYLYTLCASMAFPLIAGSINLPVGLLTEHGEVFNAVSLILSYLLVAGIAAALRFIFSSIPLEQQLMLTAVLALALSIILFVASFLLLNRAVRRGRRV